MTKKTAALVGCSDPLPEHEKEDVKRLIGVLENENIEVKVSPLLFSGSRVPAEKAGVLNGFFGDPSVDFIFDVSGGDLANTVLPFLDWDLIRASRAMFFGFSDLSTVINAIIAKTGCPAVNYQIRNLLYDDAENQLKHFREQIITCRFDVKCLSPVFLRGSAMQGKVFGGNIRCFLKLAGTEFWPDMTGGVLLLESLGGGVYQMITALEQYRQLGVFDRINGILLGTFTVMEEKQLAPDIEEIVLQTVPEHIPVAKTRLLGHYPDSRALQIGAGAIFERSQG